MRMWRGNQAGKLARRAFRLRRALTRIERAGGRIPSKDNFGLFSALSAALCCALKAADCDLAEGAIVEAPQKVGSLAWLDPYQGFAELADGARSLWGAAGLGPEQARWAFQAIGCLALAWAFRGVCRRWAWRDLQPASARDVEPLREELARVESQREKMALDQSAKAGKTRKSASRL